MKLIVCGGRTYWAIRHVFAELDRIHAESPITLLIHGAAPGADTLAGQWARANGVPQFPLPAEWARFGKRAAGPMRNQAMAYTGADLCVAFPGGAGTRDMIQRAADAGIKVLILS